MMMDVHTPKALRRSTRLRVDIPVSVTSLDRMRPFAEQCSLLVVSAQGCGFRSPRAIQLETPVMFNDLPGGGSVTGRVANCLPLGNEGFLVGVALYNPGNVWGIANPPEDWSVTTKNDPVAAKTKAAAAAASPAVGLQKKSWPYNVFEHGAEAPLRRK